MENTIKINGRASLPVKPDSTRIMVNIEYTAKEYPETIQYAEKAQKEAEDCIVRAGFDASELKTVSWDIVMEYQYHMNDRNEQIREFSGYRYRHSLMIELSMDHKAVGRILGELSGSSLTPEISLHYYVSELEKYRDGLLAQAVEDCRHKAEVIAKAGGVRLGRMVSAVYTRHGEESVRGAQLAAPKMMAARNFSMPDITPADIELSEAVTVEWELLEKEA